MSSFIGYVKADTDLDFNNWLGYCYSYNNTPLQGSLNDAFVYPNEIKQTMNYTKIMKFKTGSSGECIGSVNDNLPDLYNPSINSLTGISNQIYSQSELEALGWDFNEE